VVFLVDAQNLRSRRAVEKLGATECGEHRGMVLCALHWEATYNSRVIPEHSSRRRD